MEFEGCVPALVGAGLMPVHPKFAGPVHCPEMEDDSLVLPSGRELETTLVPKGLGIIQAACHSGQRRFQGEWHQYLPIGSRHSIRVDGAGDTLALRVGYLGLGPVLKKRREKRGCT